jgi:hypothetical protein
MPASQRRMKYASYWDFRPHFLLSGSRVWKSTRNESCFSVALRPLSMTDRHPGTSTASGFATKTCLPASTAAAACSG